MVVMDDPVNRVHQPRKRMPRPLPLLGSILAAAMACAPAGEAVLLPSAIAVGAGQVVANAPPEELPEFGLDLQLDVGDADGRRLQMTYATGTNEAWITSERFLTMRISP